MFSFREEAISPVSKYIRWQILLTLLGVILVGTLLFYITLKREEPAVPEPTPLPQPSPGTTVVRTRGGTYVEGVAGSPWVINPPFSQFNDLDRDLCALIFEGLTAIDERNEVVPWLAERWEVSEDGLTYTFYLRDDVHWQDGEPFTADDVVFTIGILQNSDFSGWASLSELWRLVDVVQLDTYTVRFTLREYFASFLDYTPIGLVPKHLLEDVPVATLASHPFNVYPVGTGLFKVKEYTEEHIVLETNPYHHLWGETVLDHIEFKFYPNYEHLLTAYEKGEVMGFSHLLAEDVDRARANPNLKLLSARLSGYSMISINVNNPDAPFFQDRRVRQALYYALDRQRLIDGVLGGQGLIIHSPIMPQSWAHSSAVKQYAYDPGQAVALLEEAGWTLPDPVQEKLGDLKPEDARIRVKQGERLEFTLITVDVPDRVDLAHVIAQQWQAIGARVHVQPVSMSDLTLNHLLPREFDAALLQWQSLPTPDPYPMWHSTQSEGAGQNYSGFNNRDADEAIEQARLLTDRGERTELYHRFQEIFVEELPALLLYQPIYTYGVDQRVRNIQIAPMPDPSGRFRNVFQWAVLEIEIPLSDLNDQVGDKLDKQGDPWYDGS